MLQSEDYRKMITTIITTSSVTASVAGFGMALGLVAVIALVAFLCVKELAISSEPDSRRFLAQSLDVAIIPLIIVVAMIMVIKTTEILA
jgi:phosphotransferase system  glucose/maltose/N-acetylglucosamine-specific IIC component